MNGVSRSVNACSRMSIILALLSFYSLWPQPVCQATTYYVDGGSPVGRDTNPGTERRPWNPSLSSLPCCPLEFQGVAEGLWLAVGNML